MARSTLLSKDGRGSRESRIIAHVATRVRARREQLGLSQEELGASLGITHMHMRAYENGTRRIEATHLFDLSRLLDVPIRFFYADGTGQVGPGTSDLPTSPDLLETLGVSPLDQREARDLMDAFGQLSASSVRQHILDLVRDLAAGVH